MSDEQILEAWPVIDYDDPIQTAAWNALHNAKRASVTHDTQAAAVIAAVLPLIEGKFALRVAAEIEAQVTPQRNPNLLTYANGLVEAYRSAARIVRGAVTPE